MVKRDAPPQADAEARTPWQAPVHHRRPTFSSPKAVNQTARAVLMTMEMLGQAVVESLWAAYPHLVPLQSFVSLELPCWAFPPFFRLPDFFPQLAFYSPAVFLRGKAMRGWLLEG
jgi:hypothetical protein